MMNRHWPILIAIFALALLFGTGCSSFDTGISADGLSSPVGPGGNLGVTPGGSQSFEYIRTLIESGQIPAPEAYLVESIYSEFDLPVEGPPSDQRLTVNGAHAWAANEGLPGAGLYMQLGFSSDVPADEYTRPAQNLSIVLDRSGSMGGSGSDGNRKMDIAKRAVHNIIDQLGEQDVLSIVLFDDRLDILVEPQPVTDRDAIHELVNSVYHRGTTNMDVGLRQGYSFVRDYPDNGDRLQRVILLTDALPNTGNDSDLNFRSIVQAGAANGIGLTAVGVGIDFDQSLIEFIATQQGGNYYYMNSIAKADQVFADEFGYMVNPFVYDFTARVTPGQDCELLAGFGFPGDDPTGTLLEIPTMFLSDERGAVLLSFEPPGHGGAPPVTTGDTIANIELSYRTPENEVESDELSEQFNGPPMNEETEYYSQPGVHLAVVLTRMVLSMRQATTCYSETYQEEEPANPPAWDSMLERLADYIAEHDAQLEAVDLTAERDLVLKLRANMGWEGGE